MDEHPTSPGNRAGLRVCLGRILAVWIGEWKKRSEQEESLRCFIGRTHGIQRFAVVILSLSSTIDLHNQSSIPKVER